jgi:leader peptidase (prepilin peptidase)/N-methyltransferase
MLELLSQSPLLAGGYVFIVGLCVGSFLNVVIYRLPVMMQRSWQAEAREILELEPVPEGTRFNLVTPASRCPHCGHRISALENIPLLSWIVLRGRCRECKTPISMRYPLVELATALVSLLVFLVMGATPAMLVALPMVWALITLTMIDFDTQYLPDDIVLPLLWAGIIVNLPGFVRFTPLASSVLGAVFGYLSLWTVNMLFRLVTKRDGMGYGDFKLLAALGAWMGWLSLPLILLLSSVVGSVVGIGYLIVRRESAPFPFGPYIAMAGIIALLWGQPLLHWYLGV